MRRLRGQLARDLKSRRASLDGERTIAEDFEPFGPHRMFAMDDAGKLIRCPRISREAQLERLDLVLGMKSRWNKL